MTKTSYVDPVSLFQNGESNPIAELESCIERIEARESQIHAFTHLAIEEAQAAAACSAKRWQAGQPLSIIDGLVIGLKDVIETHDMPTGQGSPIWQGSETRRDAACVDALRAAGAIILGKCTTTEFAFVAPLHETRNPHDLERTPGGSSSGSGAAVAAGFVHAALGTQVLGSTLRPASYCGCVGYKTSLGALHRGGIFDHQSQGCIGIFGTSAGQVWSIAQAISMRVGGEPGHRALVIPDSPPVADKPRTLALLSPGPWGRAEERAISELNRVIRSLRLEGIEVADSASDPRIRAFEESLRDISNRSYALVDWEHRWPVNSYNRCFPGGVSSNLAARMARCEAEMSQADYHGLLDWREELRRAYYDFAGHFEGTLCLSATAEAPNGLAATGDVSMNIPASTMGIPAISLPLLSSNGLPLGLQVMGRLHHDADLIAIAQWLEQADL